MISGLEGVGVAREDLRARLRGVRRERVVEVERVGRSSSSRGRVGRLEVGVLADCCVESSPEGPVVAVLGILLVSTSEL